MQYVLSPVAIIKAANRSLAGGDPDAYMIPESDSRLEKIVKELKAFRNDKLIKSVITEDLHTGRFRAIIPDIGSNKAYGMNKKFKEFMAANNKLVDYKITGTAELIDKNNRSLIWNMSKSMLIALAVVSIIFWILFRSWRMVLIGLIPNLIPLMIMAGTMGYVGISMKMSTSILFTIAFGIAVDDTVHFLSKLRLEMRNRQSLVYAVKRTYLTTGKAMIIMTMLLCVGFLVLSLSSFQAIKMIGIMVSFTLFMAMINEVVLMPVLLLFFYGGKKAKTAEIAAGPEATESDT
jgi:predicted RND superfamily exporter protein